MGAKASMQTTLLAEAAKAAALRAAHELQSAQDQPRQHEEESRQRHLPGRAGPRADPAGRDDLRHRLRAQQRAHAAALAASASRTIRSPTPASSARTMPTRPAPTRRCSSTSGKVFNLFMGSGALGTVIDDFNGDNFDHGRTASSAAPTSARTPTAAGRSSSIRCRPGRRAGARSGSRPSRTTTTAPSGSTPKAACSRTAATTSTSTRRTATSTASRCCA